MYLKLLILMIISCWKTTSLAFKPTTATATTTIKRRYFQQRQGNNYDIYYNTRRPNHQHHQKIVMFSSSTNSEETIPPTRILCYGDSLTAGTSYPLFDLFPYAPHLEQILNERDKQQAQSSSGADVAQQQCRRFVVRHRGMPGWTASAMVDALDDGQYGLRSAIRGIQNPSLSMVIILAGTNDLGYANSVEEVLTPIKQLHQIAFEAGVPQTIAIGIPPSGYQNVDTNAKQRATEINQQLQQFCQQSDGKSTFVPFPFEYDNSSGNWAPDGLHFSPQGYQVLGTSLADPVFQALNR